MKSRKDLRRYLRAARQGIDSRARRRAESMITARIRRLPAYRRARRVAAYLPFDAEVDLSDLLADAMDSGKDIYLPLVGRGSKRAMQFLRVRPGDPLRVNHFGIGEPIPVTGNRQPPGRIDLVLVPVVGFDASGTRLGMGGGFYDRCFARLATRSAFRNRLIGVAFECQKVDRIERMTWDVPMSAVVTERAVYRGAEPDRTPVVMNEDQR